MAMSGRGWSVPAIASATMSAQFFSAVHSLCSLDEAKGDENSMDYYERENNNNKRGASSTRFSFSFSIERVLQKAGFFATVFDLAADFLFVLPSRFNQRFRPKL